VEDDVCALPSLGTPLTATDVVSRIVVFSTPAAVTTVTCSRTLSTREIHKRLGRGCGRGECYGGPPLLPVEWGRVWLCPDMNGSIASLAHIQKEMN
jgi:hypothetical protein